jgi:hypothetical protein
VVSPHEPTSAKGKSADFETFVCTCDAKGRQGADELMKEVKARLSRASVFMEPPLSDATFLTAVASSLHFDFRASINRILSDHWSAVFAESDDGTYRTVVECDLVEHGIAATWKAFADRNLALPDQTAP